jgi:aminoglycoside 2'-N-acetyltransferase I
MPGQRLLGERPAGVLPVGTADDRTDLERARVRQSTTKALTPVQIEAIRTILWAAFPAGEEGFSEDDWQHALGGRHFLLELDGSIVAHAAVVERALEVDGRPVRTGYVEAVATDPARQGMGLGTKLMAAVDRYIGETFELGALGTGSHHFYQRLGWETWRGPSSVRIGSGTRRTPDEDGYILILRTDSNRDIDLDARISCEWRPGDVW